MPPIKVVLLVEDNAHDELLTIRALRKYGIRSKILVCRDGAEALDWLFLKGEHASRDAALLPSVVLLDLKLPKLNGHAVLHQMRSEEATRSVPVVVLTTSKEQADIALAYEFGANSYVQKPVKSEEFAETIQQLGAYWLRLNETSSAGSLPERKGS